MMRIRDYTPGDHGDDQAIGVGTAIFRLCLLRPCYNLLVWWD